MAENNAPATPPATRPKKEALYVVTATMLGTRDPVTLENLVEGDVRPASVFGDALARYKSLKAVKRWTAADEEAANEAQSEE